MPWLWRQSDQHKCQLPPLNDGKARPGDLFECDHCKKIYVVGDSQREGLYFRAATPRDMQ